MKEEKEANGIFKNSWIRLLKKLPFEKISKREDCNGGKNLPVRDKNQWFHAGVHCKLWSDVHPCKAKLYKDHCQEWKKITHNIHSLSVDLSFLQEIKWEVHRYRRRSAREFDFFLKKKKRIITESNKGAKIYTWWKKEKRFKISCKDLCFCMDQTVAIKLLWALSRRVLGFAMPPIAPIH